MRSILINIATGIFAFSFLLVACGGETGQESPITDQPDQVQEKDNPEEDTRYIIFFGNSLTAGYGLEESESFPALIQNRIDELGLPYRVVNAGLSGETTSGGKNRIDWVLRQPVDIFVLELGGNDMLRGLNLDDTRANLGFIIEKVREKNAEAKIVLAGMQAPPNMGADYVKSFNAIYPELASEYNVELIPFLLDGVGGIDSLNLDDRIHPNVKGQKIVADNVWEVLKPMLNEE